MKKKSACKTYSETDFPKVTGVAAKIGPFAKHKRAARKKGKS